MSDSADSITEVKKAEAQKSPQAPARAAKIVRAVFALIVVAALGGTVWYFLLRPPNTDPNVIQVSGRIEGDESAVSSKVSGRVREITVREGDQVKVGQVIAVIDDEQVRAREEQERSAVQQAEARVAGARQQIAVLEAQLEQSDIGVEQARVDAQGRVSQAEAQVAQAQAQLTQAEAAYGQARYDEERYTTLAKDGDVPERTGRQARSTAEAQAATVQAARRQVEAARAALTIARANLSNAAMRSSQSLGIRRQIIQARADIIAAEAEAERARARLREVQADRNDLQVVAPIDGTVATRSAELGEVVTAGAPLVTLINLDAVYLRGFIPEGEIGRVRAGQQGRVFLDSAPDSALDAVVTRIDPEASFTPENTYFQNDRVKQVVGIKLQLKSAGGFAKPGMPADGEVIVDDRQLTARAK